MSDDARRRVCEELARTLATEEGLRQARLLQSLDLALPSGPSATTSTAGDKPTGSVADKLAAAREAAARALRPKAAPAPVAIGPWRPQTSDGALSFVRAEPPGLGDPWPPHEVLRPKAPGGPRRIVFLGESAAAGWFYAPQLTPALVLERQLRSVAGEGSWEVVNLAKVDLSAPELMALLGAVHQLQPDAVVVFAGNNWPQRYQVPAARRARARPRPRWPSAAKAWPGWRASATRAPLGWRKRSWPGWPASPARRRCRSRSSCPK